MGIPTLISTATASNASSVDITSGIDSTYDEYMFVFTDINPATTGSFTFQVNVAGQSGFNETITNTRFNAAHNEDDSNTELAYDSSSDLAQSTAALRLCNTSSGSDESCTGILHLFNPASTTYVKHWYSRMCSLADADPPNYAQDNYVSGYINTTSAIDEITFLASVGNFDGVIQMYGIA